MDCDIFQAIGLPLLAVSERNVYSALQSIQTPFFSLVQGIWLHLNCRAAAAATPSNSSALWGLTRSQQCCQWDVVRSHMSCKSAVLCLATLKHVLQINVCEHKARRGADLPL